MNTMGAATCDEQHKLSIRAPANRSVDIIDHDGLQAHAGCCEWHRMNALRQYINRQICRDCGATFADRDAIVSVQNAGRNRCYGTGALRRLAKQLLVILTRQEHMLWSSFEQHIQVIERYKDLPHQWLLLLWLLRLSLRAQ